ncbi:MAG TPA: dTDP-4-dehydrorhamnose reductase [Sphingomicrobium sp.]|nr:dTDP-4-dehydrorhamnose reductase [Sphingomicrobium sp.]
MRIVVTGREGQVARSLVERALGGVEILCLGRPTLDLAGGTSEIVSTLKAVQPDVIVSAAAYTQVDKAEIEAELAFAVNEQGPRSLAIAARECSVPLVHLSTDYVFDGRKAEPYVEGDATGPASIYGASKLAGEQAVLAEHDNCAVLRTAWVYSPFGSNFVKTMLRLAGERNEVAVVADQRGNPTSALDIADGILSVAANLRASDDPLQRGIFHMTAAGEATWAEFAEVVFASSADMHGPSAHVKRIGSADYPTAAKRPCNSRLNCAKLERTHGVRLPEWRQSVMTVVSRLLRSAG